MTVLLYNVFDKDYHRLSHVITQKLILKYDPSMLIVVDGLFHEPLITTIKNLDISALKEGLAGYASWHASAANLSPTMMHILGYVHFREAMGDDSLLTVRILQSVQRGLSGRTVSK